MLDSLLDKTNLIAFKTILLKEIVRFLRIWVQTILPPAVTISLYFIIFGHMVGSQIQHIAGFSYMQYIAPGLIMMSVIINSYANVSSSFFSSKFQRSIEEMLIAPISPSLILIGFIAGGVARGLAVGFVVTCVALFFTKLVVAHIGIMLAVVLLSSVLFSLAGFLNGIYAKKFDDISVIPTFVLTPLTYLGGIFYSIDLLPEFWKSLSLLNPVLYMVNAFRYGLLGISDVSITVAMTMIVSLTIGLFILNLMLLQRGVGLRS